ncbi:MAG: glutaminyl-peptide cyclotransferase [Bacteroidota bacterium]
MKASIFRFFFVHPLMVVLLYTATYCTSPEKKRPATEAESRAPRIDNLRIIQPSKDAVFTLGEQVDIELELKKSDLRPDSVVLLKDNERIRKFEDDLSLTWKSTNASLGQNRLRFLAYYGDSIKEPATVNVTMLSDIVPKELNYRLVNTFPHDEKAFIQGLIYDDGFLYESTGQYGKSSLRKIKPETGEIISILDIGSEFFGEGIAIYNDKIFQLTWKEQVGFIYDKTTFTQLQKIYYDTKEGWGLTFDGDQFILSDGTARLYFLEPEYFTQTDQIVVYDNKGMVTYLNELEYIHDMVFANIWGEDFIVVIDPATGKVLAKLNLSNLVPKNLRRNKDNVLNGIAYNAETGHLFVTGKYWPVLYEIDITDELHALK